MIDFIEYVVGELKGKRLSKRDAVGLIEQFSRQAAASPEEPARAQLHPLVHRDASDGAGQRFRSAFTGDEFFLRDHRVQGEPVLPAAAYLEMVHAAMAATAPLPQGHTLEIRNVIWAQPLNVAAPREVTLSLSAAAEGVDFEIASVGQQLVHCQGQARSLPEPRAPRMDLDALRMRMKQEPLRAAEIYAAIAGIGIDIGPAHQAVRTIYRGEREQLAHVVLPGVVEASLGEYVLHPSLLDGVLQAAGALLAGPDLEARALPFALESLRVFGRCTDEMFAWARCAAGSAPDDAAVKLDIDLCDGDGNVCAALRGFSSRVSKARAADAPEIGQVLATPHWEAAPVAAAPAAGAARHVLLCGVPRVDAARLAAALDDSGEVERIEGDSGNSLASRYEQVALACFERIQSLLQRKSAQPALVQLVIADTEPLLAGLSGLFKTAARENPRLLGQIVITANDVDAQALSAQLRAAEAQAHETLVEFTSGGARVLRWRELPEADAAPGMAFKDDGVYLITGGLGGLGLLFAREILARTARARVVLCGRGAADAGKHGIVDALNAAGPVRATYRQLDLGDRAQVAQVLRAIHAEHGALHGILHAAGMIADAFILRKTRDEFARVLAPKVAGTIHLDEASRHFDLDFFALFSAGAAVYGNAGQSDYAAANGFLDRFAAHRNRLAAANERRGVTVAIDWPLWEAGGMRMDPASRAALRRETGMVAMRTATGLAAFQHCLRARHDQVLVVEGDVERVRHALLAGRPMAAPATAAAAAPMTGADAGSLLDRTQTFLRREFSAVLALPANRIDPQAPLEKYGIDSILAMALTNQLEATFGSLPKTLFFEYRSIRELTGYFLEAHAAKLAALFAAHEVRAVAVERAPASVARVAAAAPVARGTTDDRAPGPNAQDAQAEIAGGPIAIVGLSGRYPESPDLETFWHNLRDGKDCIVEVPRARWEWRDFFSADRSEPGRHYSKWGGFIQGVDEFDPVFFGISPREARIMDPQERLFLQYAWSAVEDAGYTRASLQRPNQLGLPGQVGVYVGVMYGEYNLSGSLAGIANRVSSVMNLHGPSMALDTMCSSSLTAIHLACQDLKLGRTDLAIAGGVNVSIHPSKYLMLSAGQFISSDGHCQSFGEGGDGYIPGEGVGAVVLKRLADAERDGDHIHGLIRGSALNHGGKTNGYTVPNPQAQTSAIVHALAEARTPARHVSYVEAHGTGTKLGDPIEIAALTKAFQHAPPGAPARELPAGNCALGSVKSNIGHCEAAAGIAGLTKVLLQMRHRQIVPSLHSAKLNPHIEFARTPFVVNQALRAWEAPVIDGRVLARVAGLSSFGAGGSNAHVIVEEYVCAPRAARPPAPVLVPLAARTPEQLSQRARDLLAFLRAPARQASPPDLAELAYTLQVGREALDERLGLVVTSAGELAAKLDAWLSGARDLDGVSAGSARQHRDTLSLFDSDEDFQLTIERWVARGHLAKLLELWVRGFDLDWRSLHAAQPRRMSLPTYPFAREKYWIETVGQVVAPAAAAAPAPAQPSVSAPVAAAPPEGAPAAKPRGIQLSEPGETDFESLVVAARAAAPPAIFREAALVAQAVAPPALPPAADDAARPHEVQLPERALSRQELQRQLAVTLAEALYMQVADVDDEKTFVDLGLDSIVGVEWVKVINKKFGLSIAATRVYDYPNIRELASFVAQEMARLPAPTAPPASAAPEAAAVAPHTTAPMAPHTTAPIMLSALDVAGTALDREPAAIAPRPAVIAPVIVEATATSATSATPRAEPPAMPPRTREKIAIVGMSGRYPQAGDLHQFWQNLAQGKNSVVEIPRSRWDVDAYFDPDPTRPGKVYCKSLGLLDDVDCFDPLFFQISPAEARTMDPQHRVFMQEAYRAFEDAGYSNQALSNRKCGVYLGIMSNEYALLLAKDGAFNHEAMGTSYAIGAARIAYHLNLKGPAIPIDTACSSSLVGVHLACQALLNREIDMALAGGVTFYLTPDSYLAMCRLGMLSPDGQCKTFDNSADGFVPGEGAGALVLKRLSDAEADGDLIHGVILGSGINQDGKTNGITAPSVSSQIELERELYARHDIDPDTISYVETHGTGTRLGDPIELEALATVFSEKTARRNFCALGSVKTNIGHTSGAAGVASVQKVLLSMRHRTLAPTLNVKTENALFDFARSPFYICRERQEWKSPPGVPRRAAVSSFGFSGTNAHLVLEEYVAPARAATGSMSPAAIVLSARTPAQLEQRARQLLEFVTRPEREPDLAALAYTLQVGREAFRERLALVVHSVDELAAGLRAFIGGSPARGPIYRGQAGRDRDALPSFSDADLQDTGRRLELWVRGLDVDWNASYAGAQRPRRIGLPGYPFARERYWPDAAPSAADSAPVARAAPRMDAPASAVAQASHAAQRVTYYPRWNPAALERAAATLSGTIVLLDAPRALFEAVKRQLANNPKAVPILVSVGDAFEQLAPDAFTVNLGREDHFHRLVDSLESADWLPLHVVHCCTSATDDAVPERDVHTLFHLTKALLARKCAARLLSLCRGEAGAPLAAALAGFGRSLVLENPKFQAKVVEIRGDASASTASDTARLVLDELREQRDSEVRYLPDGPGLGRRVRALERYLPAARATAELPLKQRGVYLVTGGLGGLGFIICDYLVRNFQARLVLVGRSAPEALAGKLQLLRAQQPEVTYVQADVARSEDVERAVAEARQRFGGLDGVIHAAGVNRDSFLLKKSREELDAVLAPKVRGALHLDRATRADDLDLFVLFSSVAGVLGNPGQCDYAYANHFLDAFAESRETARARGERSGRTLAIDWPFWEAGGMTQSAEQLARTAAEVGLQPLPTQAGLEFWEEILRSDLCQAVALYGDDARIASRVACTAAPAPARAAEPASADAVTRAEDYLRGLIGAEIKLPAERIDVQERFEAYGIDSIVIGRLNASLARDLGALPKTLFYEYATIEELAKFLAVEAAAVMRGGSVLAPAATPESAATPEPARVVTPAREMAPVRQATPPSDVPEPIAIIGVHGSYPGSRDLDEYWRHLRAGSDLVGLVPRSRWDAAALYDPDPAKVAEGKIYCQWGAFLEDVDKFDAAFFNIPAAEAQVMDPQERLVLGSVWSAVEDAGYTRDSLRQHFPKGRSADVGVFIGVTTQSYNLLADEAPGALAPSSLPWSIANRVSYFFDFQGPSMPVDTACSSSLVAIHLACESLRRHDCQVAIAGGVNLYLHPAKYRALCQRRMLAAGGKCRSFGAGDDGFVPGEGVGTLVLKPLARALADGDHVHAVVASSAFEHCGRTNGYSAPNPNSQAHLIDHTLRRAHIHPETIGFVEAHGTGTQLGDSLEIAALTQAFGRQTGKRHFCPVGSVKSNLGHAESAAGIAGVTKVLLQMRHRELAPTLHSEEVNPSIEFAESPFYLQHGCTAWEAGPHPRRALVNSFGAGGVNACVVIEEHTPAAVEPAGAGQWVITLSAHTDQQLREYARRLEQYVLEGAAELPALAYTLHVGREALPERLALRVATLEALRASLGDFLAGRANAGLHRARGARQARASAQRQAALAGLIDSGDLAALARAWTCGEDVDWQRLFAQPYPRRVPLPTYPFALERHWVPPARAPRGEQAAPGRASAPLHPLVAYNTSTLHEVSFSSLLSAGEFYARDHAVNGQMIFPGAGFLEIAVVSAGIAGTARVAKIQDVVWVQPLAFDAGLRMLHTALKTSRDSSEYVIASYGEDREKVVHCEGVIVYEDGAHAHDEHLDFDALEKSCARRVPGAQYYERFENSGISYGPSFRTLRELWVADDFALSRVAIAPDLEPGFDEFTLHPSIVDGALQTVSALMSADPSVPYLPFAIEEVEIRRSTAPACRVHVEPAGAERRGASEVRRFNVRIANERGLVLVNIRGFCVRSFQYSPAGPVDSSERKS